MNHIYYNGVSLNCLDVVEYKKTANYNGLDYLHTTHRLTVRAVFNPSTQVDGYPGEEVGWLPGNDPARLRNPAELGPLVGPLESFYVPVGGTRPILNRPGAYTAQAVQHQLLTPRGSFTWVLDGVKVLVSPLPGFLTDSTNGPFPIACTVTPSGSKTFDVVWTFETTISECPRFSRNFQPVLSSTWSMEHDVDQDMYVVKRVQGKTIFDAQAVRGRRLDANNDDPAFVDTLRSNFFFSIPEGFKRQHIKVRLLEDGLTAVWSYEDREMPFTFIATGITPHVTRIECTQSFECGAISAAKLVGDVPVVGKPLSYLFDWGKVNLSMMERLLGDRLGGLGWVDSGTPWATALREAWSLSTHIFQVRVWGDRDSYRVDLEAVAREVIKQRRRNLAALQNKLLPLGTKLTHDVAGSFVEGVETYMGPPIVGPTDTDPLPSRFPTQSLVFPGENTPGVLEWENLAGATWPMPTDDHSRGTFLEYLIAQALSFPCNTSANVPPQERDLTIVPGLGQPPPWIQPDPPPPPAKPPQLIDPVFTPR